MEYHKKELAEHFFVGEDVRDIIAWADALSVKHPSVNRRIVLFILRAISLLISFMQLIHEPRFLTDVREGLLPGNHPFPCNMKAFKIDNQRSALEKGQLEFVVW